MAVNSKQNFKHRFGQTKLGCGPGSVWLLSCHVAGHVRQGNQWGWGPFPDSPPKPEGPEPGVAPAGVWPGHPDVRVPAGSSASPCLFKEGLELESSPMGARRKGSSNPRPLSHPSLGPGTHWGLARKAARLVCRGRRASPERKTLRGRRKGKGAGVSARAVPAPVCHLSPVWL